MSEFKKIDTGRAHERNEPVLAIYQSGQGRFNTPATEQFIGDAECIVWYYAADERKLGAKIGADGEGTRKLSESGGGASTSMQSRLKKVGIDIDELDETVVLPLTYNEEHDLLVADLDPLFDAIEASDEERSEHVAPEPDGGASTVESRPSPVERALDDEDGGGDETADDPIAQLEPHVRELVPDGWDYDDIVTRCEEKHTIYEIADDLGLERSKAAFLLRKLDLLDYMGRPGPSGDRR